MGATSREKVGAAGACTGGIAVLVAREARANPKAAHVSDSKWVRMAYWFTSREIRSQYSPSGMFRVISALVLREAGAGERTAPLRTDSQTRQYRDSAH